MAKSTATIVFGIIYIVLVGLVWIFEFVPTYWQYSYVSPIDYGPYLQTTGGFIALYGNFLLVPSLILNTIFFASAEGNTSVKVGFGLGVAGWALGILGCFINFLSYYTPSPLTTLVFILYIALAVFGSLLFARKSEGGYETSSTYTRRTTRPISRPATPPVASPPGPPCAKCDRATRLIPEYNRYYCHHCKEYV